MSRLPTNSPTPPAGYSVVPRDSSIPSFIREDVGPVTETVQPAPQNQTPGTEKIAESLSPGAISVYDQSQYTPQTRVHEMEHQFQQTRADGNIKLPGGYEIPVFGDAAPTAPLNYTKGDLRNYDYGGEAGLVALRNSGKTSANLNSEQQADLVADYKAKQDAYLAKVKSGKAKPADLHAMSQTYQAYHPFVQQMASLPKGNGYVDAVKHLLGLSTGPLAPAPAAPGLPDYATPGLGVAPADPLMGGQSQPTKR